MALTLIVRCSMFTQQAVQKYTLRRHHSTCRRRCPGSYQYDRPGTPYTVPKEGKPFAVPLVEYDGALHADFRKLLSPFFMPKAVHALQYRMQEFTNVLIDGFHASGECDFTRDFALKMPIGIMMHVLGLQLCRRKCHPIASR